MEYTTIDKLLIESAYKSICYDIYGFDYEYEWVPIEQQLKAIVDFLNEILIMRLCDNDDWWNSYSSRFILYNNMIFQVINGKGNNDYYDLSNLVSWLVREQKNRYLWDKKDSEATSWIKQLFMSLYDHQKEDVEDYYSDDEYNI